MANTMTVWYFLIDHNKKFLGAVDDAHVPRDASVSTLKKKIKEGRAIDLGHVDAARLDVWRCKDRDVGEESYGNLKKCIKNFDFSEESNDVKRVDPRTKVEELGLASKEKLLVQMPGAFQIISFSDSDALILLNHPSQTRKRRVSQNC